MQTGTWEAEVMNDTWLRVPPNAMMPIPSPDGDYHVCEYAGTIRCFFQPGQVERDPLDGEKHRDVAFATRSAPPQAVAHDPGAVTSSPAVRE